MAGRNRNRPAIVKEEADEERQLWGEVKSSGNRIDQLVAEHNAKWKRMHEIKSLLDIQFSRDEEPSEQLEEELMKLTRENVKLCDEVVTAIEGDSEQDTNSILGALNILSALRAANEPEPSTPAPRGASQAKVGRDRKRKTEALSIASDDRDSVPAESPAAPSPKVHIPVPSRLKVNTNASSRAGSAGPGREASVKIEDGADSGIEAKHSPLEPRPRFTEGTEVLYRRKGQPGKASDPNEGEGILCVITKVTGEGKQRRYEIRDADPDANPQPYRASLQQMTPIPSPSVVLPELKPKANVLALYPGTTTFYKAEVVKGKGGDGEVKGGFLRLRFEGEDEADKFEDVERRYVLSEWTGK